MADEVPRRFRQSAVSGTALPPPPPRWLWKVALAAVVLYAAVWHGAAAVTAQVPVDIGADFAACSVAGPQYSEVRNQADDFGTPETQDPHRVTLIDRVLEELFFCSMEIGNGPVMEIGNGILTPLLIIMTVWFGVGVMFTGIDPTSVVSFLMRLGFVVMLMQNYYYETMTDTPFGESRGVVWSIGWQGVELGRRLMTDARQAVDEVRREALEMDGESARSRELIAALDDVGDVRPSLETIEMESMLEGWFRKRAKQPVVKVGIQGSI